MGSFHEELVSNFPETPDSFRRCVEQAVAEQAAEPQRRIRMSRILIPVAACIVLACGTVAAAELPVFQRWLAGLGVNGPTAGEFMIPAEDIHAEEPELTEDKAAGSENIDDKGADSKIGEGSIADSGTASKPLFTVTDAYFDGATLMFWAVPDEALGSLEFGDHVYINGVDNRLEYVVETEDGSGVYECKVTIMDSNLGSAAQGELEVTVGVYMPEGGKEDFSFTIVSDKLQSVNKTENQLIELTYGTVEVCDLRVAPSAINFNLKWLVPDEDILDVIYIPNYFVEDSSGNRRRLDEMAMTTGVNFKVYNEAEGAWEFVQEIEIRDFDSASEYMVLIPYEGGYSEDGSHVPGTETPREDMSFTIQMGAQ